MVIIDENTYAFLIQKQEDYNAFSHKFDSKIYCKQFKRTLQVLMRQKPATGVQFVFLRQCSFIIFGQLTPYTRDGRLIGNHEGGLYGRRLLNNVFYCIVMHYSR